MNDLSAYLLANTYSAFTPAINAVASLCTINGEEVTCPSFLNILGPGMIVALLALAVLIVAAMWKIFLKAGQPGWASIVPIYNMVVMLHIVRRPTWWILLWFVPFVNIIIALVVTYELAKVFGKGLGYTVGLIALPVIFYPMLGFGKATYMAPQSQATPAFTN